MGKLHAVLAAAIETKATKHSQRKIIIFKDNKSYNQCVRFLKNKNIIPLKQVKSARMVCCHVRNPRQLQGLSKHPSVHSIETDVPVKAHGRVKHIKSAQPSLSRPFKIPWGIQRIKAPQVWPTSLGQGIRVGIIDTGIGPSTDLLVYGGINTINNKKSFRDDNGHGTFVAGITAARGKRNMIAGAAPYAKLYSIKALDASGSGFVSDIIEGVEWCIQHRIRIINMSLGLNQPSPALRRVVRKANRKGIVIVASAGNGGKSAGGIDEPAKYPEVIAVAASNKRNKIANFSSRGKGIDLTAPGANIVSLKIGNGTTTGSGTSFSAPHVTGSSALLLRINRRLTPNQISRLMTSTAVKLKGFSKQAQGAGLLQVNHAARKLMIASKERKH
ncbi:S8 family peptidase [Paenibacillus guangzhouensis]|uniref:S8 family peptidase n=1 Tax=Paenibacillus guangzhouensis TaxID=1473112 RepID=UPI001266BD1B|nr:S8 family peptidase [Paenibacillus guangzhouensis]